MECHKSRDCRGCKRKDGCVWTRRKLANSERFRWDCLTKSAVEKVDGTQLLIPWQCPKSCPERATCAECLANSSAVTEDADPKCVWSEQSKSCLPPSAVPLHCFGGANCGRLFEDSCPAPWDVLSLFVGHLNSIHSQRIPTQSMLHSWQRLFCYKSGGWHKSLKICLPPSRYLLCPSPC